MAKKNKKIPPPVPPPARFISEGVKIFSKEENELKTIELFRKRNK